MRSRVLAVLSVFVCLPLLAAEVTVFRSTERPVVGVEVTFSQAMEQYAAARRAGGPLRPEANVVWEGAEPSFLFPVVGSAGAFRTETVLINRLNRTQRVALFYLPIGGGPSNCNRTGVEVTLGPTELLLFTDFVPDVFRESGFGTVVAIAYSGSNPDATARIDGNARIWGLAAGGGTASQNFPAMSLVGVPNGAQMTFGLRSDEAYRTNWGIFNYGSGPRIFDIRFAGFRSNPVSIVREIPPCSLSQERVPGGPWGSMIIEFSPRDGRGEFYGYGSSVDNVSGDSFSVPSRQ